MTFNIMVEQLYTYFGSKKMMVDKIWNLLGYDLSTYIEPFAGTACVALNRPEDIKNCYINDADGHIVNVLRSVKFNPDEVIINACHPRSELDMHMMHDYLQNYGEVKLPELLKTSFIACNPTLAGYWVWGCNNWIGEWCHKDCCIKPDTLCLGNDDLKEFDEIKGTRRKKPSHRNMLTERLATWRNKPSDRNRITERLIDSDRYEHVQNLVYAIYHKLRDCRILYGDFERVLTKSYLDSPLTGIFLDPPYLNGDINYGTKSNVFSRSLKWTLDNYTNKKLRIIFCCQEKDLEGIDLPTDLKKEFWTRSVGYASGSGTRDERANEVMLHNIPSNLFHA